MRFLVDAQLPKRLAIWLNNQGYDVLHTLDLPLRNETSDAEINRISVEQERVVITKDSDFVDSFILNQVPFKLLLISTGNITNRALILIFESNFKQIILSLESHHFVEINQTSLILHS